MYALQNRRRTKAAVGRAEDERLDSGLRKVERAIPDLDEVITVEEGKRCRFLDKLLRLSEEKGKLQIFLCSF